MDDLEYLEAAEMADMAMDDLREELDAATKAKKLAEIEAAALGSKLMEVRDECVGMRQSVIELLNYISHMHLHSNMPMPVDAVEPKEIIRAERRLRGLPVD